MKLTSDDKLILKRIKENIDWDQYFSLPFNWTIFNDHIRAESNGCLISLHIGIGDKEQVTTRLKRHEVEQWIDDFVKENGNG